MKKTLITLLALAGVAVAGVDGDWAGNFSWGADTDLALTLTDAPISISEMTSDKAYKATNSGAYVGTYTPNVNIGENPANSWTLNFTVTNTSTELLDIRAITLGTFLFNGGGNPQNADTFARPVQFSLSLGDTVLSTVVSPLAGNNWDAATVIDLGAKYVTLDAGQAATLKLTAQSAQTTTVYGTFVGVKNATFSIIPEPTTATLSLLALAGLAARRRRK